MNARKEEVGSFRILPVILSLLVLIIVIVAISSNSLWTKKQLRFINEETLITKVEMKVVSEIGVNHITIIDKRQLDSIDKALKNLKEININSGGSFEEWSDISLYRGNKKIGFSVNHSNYNGWMIIIGNKTFSNDYLFGLVIRYSHITYKKTGTDTM